jgi:hypothetical protein
VEDEIPVDCGETTRPLMRTLTGTVLIADGITEDKEEEEEEEEEEEWVVIT